MKNLLNNLFNTRPPAPQSSTAATARDRLRILITHERSQKRSGPDYLPMLKEEILAVVRKYTTVEPHHVRVRREQQSNCEMLEVNVTLPAQDDSGNAVTPNIIEPLP